MHILNKVSCLFAVFFTSTALFAFSYKIDRVTYDISGKTKPEALDRTLEINTKKIFATEEDLLEYIEVLNKDIANTRTFEDFDLVYSIGKPDTDSLCPVTLNISAKDAFHFLALPYFKFSSSGGLSLKVKAKDTNFLGTMNTMNTSLDIKFKPDSDGKQFQIFEPEISFDYDFPFKVGSYDMVWKNSHSISYSWGENSPEWGIETGFVLKIPKEHTTLTFDFTQGFFRDFDYRDKGDSTYFQEKFTFSTPFKLLEVPGVSSYLYFTPSAGITYNWDPFNWNGNSGIAHPDLQGPTFNFDAGLSLSRIDWYDNYRDGFSVSLTPSASYSFGALWNEETSMMSFGLNAHLSTYKSYDSIGFYSRFWGLAYVYGIENPKINGNQRIDTYLRGVVDDRYSSYNPNKHQADVPMALVFNFDMPVHILSTDWANFKLTRKMKFMKYFDFELQASPFIDFALIQTTNEIQGYKRTFDLRDGFYAAGLELLVYPRKWPSYVVRGSVGVDIGRKLFDSLLETSWRDTNISSIEISIGIGLQY